MVSREQRLLGWSAAIWSLAMVVAASLGLEQLLAFAAPLSVLLLRGGRLIAVSPAVRPPLSLAVRWASD